MFHQESRGYDLRFCQHTQCVKPAFYQQTTDWMSLSITMRSLSRTTSLQPTHAHIHTCSFISISLQFQACFLLKGLYYCLKDADRPLKHRFQSSAATRISGRRIWRLVRTCRFGLCNNQIWLSFDLRFPMFIIGDGLSKTISIWVRQPFLGEWFLVWSATCAPSGNAIWQYTTNIRKEATGCHCVAGQDNCSRYRKACEDIYAKYQQDMKGVRASDCQCFDFAEK